MIPIRLDSRARSLALAALTVIAPLLPARLLAQAANNATAAASSDDASGRASNAVAALNSTFASVLGSSTKSGRWGVMVVSLSKGDTLFAENADQMLAPASTLKMYSAAIALERFGPDYAYKTPVLHDGTLGADGVIQGNVYLRGVGDPSLSDRFWKGDTPMDALARQLAERGVRRITGDVVGDATAFDDQLIPEGWKTTYLGAAYAARVSALSLNENLVWVSVKPNGKTASVTLEPASSTQPIISTVRVVAG